jgi:hypothetical protein
MTTKEKAIRNEDRHASWRGKLKANMIERPSECCRVPQWPVRAIHIPTSRRQADGDEASGGALFKRASHDSKELGAFCFATEFSTCEMSGGADV